MYLDGKSLDQLKSYLESNGIKTYTGKSVWSKNGIKQMLQNEKYVGDLLYQKTFRTDCISKKTIVNNGERTRYLVSNNHPAIIDRETFKLVQLELASRISKRKKSDKTIMEQGRYSGKYELSNVLVCGECGSPFRRTIKSSKGEQIAYWRCLNRMDNGKEYCRDSHGVLETKLHEAIGRALSKCISEKTAEKKTRGRFCVLLLTAITIYILLKSAQLFPLRFRSIYSTDEWKSLFYAI